MAKSADITSAGLSDLPSHQYGAILADPPWHFRGYADGFVSDRDPRRHYAIMSHADICALPVGAVAAPDAHLFLWVTGPMLERAFAVIGAWGFRYSGIAFTWIKLKRSVDQRQLRLVATADGDFHVGLGFTTRKNAEFCLLGRRGNAKRLAKDVRELIVAPRREHSRKPDETHARIERYCAGPYLELFARAQRPGWTVWGNEVGKFEGAA